MKHLFDPVVVDEIVIRIEKVSPDAPRGWGKMDVAQMLSHCGNVLEMAMGIINPPRTLIGKLIGGFFKSTYTDEKPFSMNSPTNAHVMVKDPRDFQKEKVRLLKLTRQFFQGKETAVTISPHPFFGKLTPAEWSRGMCKHTDHHLGQFGA